MNRNNSSLIRHLISAAVCIAVLTSLTACSKAPAEPTRPPHLIISSEPAATQPMVTEPVPTQSMETTAPKIEIDYDNLVTDAYAEVVYSDDGDMFCYHIPQFNLPNGLAKKVNQKIYNDCHTVLTRDVYPNMQEYGWPDSDGIRYAWGYRGDLACVLVENLGMYDLSDFYIYTVSLSTGSEVSADDLLAAFGMDRESFHDLASERLKLYWDEFIAYHEANGNSSLVDDPFLQDRINRTLSYENIRNTVPYINAKGGLSFVAEIYSMAGGDSYMHLINADGRLDFMYHADYPKCTRNHAAGSSVSRDDPLEYFIENCDRMYFTKADIQSFDAEMCLYARNAVFAKSGWIFSNANLKNYFSQYSWYHPAISPDSFTEDLLNSYRIANRDLIVSHENTLKSADLDPLQYFIENCDRRYFSASEISGLSKEELQYARNAIYAKSGRIFSMEKLASYFAKYSWYDPHIPADAFGEDMLNSYQTANRDLIVARENELNGITAEEAYAIACRYWDYHEGDIAEETGFPLYVVDDGTVEHNGTMYYSFRLRWMVTDESGSSWMSTLDQVYINSKNGECTYTIYS